MQKPIAILTGVTAVGKTELALTLAEASPISIEIINADSLLVYKGLTIGTAKPSLHDLTRVPHHLIDIRQPDEAFTSGEFFRLATHAIQEIENRGHRPLIVGGTGFYLKALLYGLWNAPPSDPKIRQELEQKPNANLFEELSLRDPPSAKRIGPNDRYRLIRSMEIILLSGTTPTELQKAAPPVPHPRFHLWMLDRADEELYSRIHQRTQSMLNQGLIEEYQQAHALFPTARSLQAVGYQQVGNYLAGNLPEGRKIRAGIPGLADEIELSTRQLVKQQRTWFRSQSGTFPQNRRFVLDADSILLEEAFRAVYA